MGASPVLLRSARLFLALLANLICAPTFADECAPEFASRADEYAYNQAVSRDERLRAAWASGNFQANIEGIGIFRKRTLELSIEAMETELAELLGEGEGSFEMIRAASTTAIAIRSAIALASNRGDLDAVQAHNEELAIWLQSYASHVNQLREDIAAARELLNKLLVVYLDQLGEAALDMMASGQTDFGDCLPESPICDAQLPIMQSGFSQRTNDLYLLIGIQSDLLDVEPPEELPEIKLVEDGEVGHLVYAGGWRRFYFWAGIAGGAYSAAASFAALKPFLPLDPMTNFGLFALPIVLDQAGKTQNFDKPIDEAREFYEIYREAQANYNAGIITRSHACLLQQVNIRVADELAALKALRDEIDQNRFENGCAAPALVQDQWLLNDETVFELDALVALNNSNEMSRYSAIGDCD